MRKLLLIILPLISFMDLLSQARIPIKPIELNNRVVIASVNGPDGFYIAHKIEYSDSLFRVGIRKWNGIYWSHFAHVTLEPLAVVNTMIFDRKNQLHLGGNFTFKKDNKSFRNIIYFDGNDWNTYTESQFFEKDQNIQSFSFVNDSLALFGNFDSIQSAIYNNIIVLNKNSFDKFRDKNNNIGVKGKINEARLVNNRLYIAGDFRVNDLSPIQGITYFENNEWNSLNKVFSSVSNFAVLENQILVVCGIAKDSLNLAFYHYNETNTTWTTINNGIAKINENRSLVAFENKIFATGSFIDTDKNRGHSLMCFIVNGWFPVNNSFESNIVDTSGDELFFISNIIPANSGILMGHKPFHIGNYKKGQRVLMGKLFIDQNLNCEYESTDLTVRNTGIKFGTDKNIIFTNDSGNFIYFFHNPENKLPSISNNFNFDFDICIQDSNILKNPLPGGFYGPVMIALQPKQTSKAKLKTQLMLLRGTQISLGGRNTMIYTTQNTGLTEASSIRIRFSGSNKLKNFVTDPPYKIVNDSTVQWDLENLKPFEVSKIIFSYAVHDNIDILNTQLNFNLHYEYFNGIETDSGNDSYNQEVVVNNELPTFKNQNLPNKPLEDVDKIKPEDKEIEYQITFQNRLNEVVNEVVIIDSINLTHDFNYTQELGASHHFTTQVVSDPDNPNLGFLIWTFANLSLTPNPDAAPEIISDKGFIKFKFVFNSLNHQEIVKNRALVIMNGVYQYPTNQVICEVDKNISVSEVFSSITSFLLYPNPAKDLIHVKIPETETGNFQYRLINSTGSLISFGNIDNEKIHLPQIPNGMYFILLNNGQTSYSQKILIQK